MDIGSWLQFEINFEVQTESKDKFPGGVVKLSHYSEFVTICAGLITVALELERKIMSHRFRAIIIS